MKLFLKYLFLLFLVFASSCKKPTDDCRNLFIDPELLEYGFFQPGTWWVIQNDSTLVRDTIHVDSVSRFMSDRCEGYLNAHYESAACYSTIRGKLARIIFQPEYDQVISEIEDYFFKFRIWAPFRTHAPDAPDVLDSLQVNSHLFRNVLVFGAPGISEQYFAKNFYWIKSYDTRDSTSYSLVDFHIIQ